MANPVCFHVLASSAWTLKKAHNYYQLPGSLSPDFKYLHARQILHKLRDPSKMILADCIRYITGVLFAITLNHR